MSSQPLVRLINRTDHDGWLLLWNGYLSACLEQGIAAPPEECTNLNWSFLMTDSEPVFGLVAESEGKLVGLLHMILHRSTFHSNHVCYLQDLFTLSECRGMGVATALIKRACSEAAERGAKRIYWQTAQTNDPAISIYEKLATRTRTINFRIAL